MTDPTALLDARPADGEFRTVTVTALVRTGPYRFEVICEPALSLSCSLTGAWKFFDRLADWDNGVTRRLIVPREVVVTWDAERDAWRMAL